LVGLGRKKKQKKHATKVYRKKRSQAKKRPEKRRTDRRQETGGEGVGKGRINGSILFLHLGVKEDYVLKNE